MAARRWCGRGFRRGHIRAGERPTAIAEGPPAGPASAPPRRPPLKADRDTPAQPLRSMREEIAKARQQPGWVKQSSGKNNGHYALPR